MQKNQHFVRDFRQFSQLATWQKDKFCSFPHRHGEATGKPDTREETGGSTKTSISCETSSNFIKFSHFAASKSTFSYEFSLEPENWQHQNRCFVRGFRQFSAHRTKCHACHGICTLSPLDAALPMRFAKNTQRDTSKVLRLPRKMTMDTPKVLRLPRKLQHIFWKCRKSIAPATQNDFRHVAEHVWMSRSATPATRNEATTRLKPPKITTSAELPIGTAIRGSRERLRTVANGCARERNVERTHPQPPDPQSETGTLATHSGKKRPTTHYLKRDWLFPLERSWEVCLGLMLFSLAYPGKALLRLKHVQRLKLLDSVGYMVGETERTTAQWDVLLYQSSKASSTPPQLLHDSTSIYINNFALHQSGCCRCTTPVLGWPTVLAAWLCIRGAPWLLPEALPWFGFGTVGSRNVHPIMYQYVAMYDVCTAVHAWRRTWTNIFQV